MANLSGLLNKKKWRGEEIGKALILNLINDFKNKSDPEHKPLFSQADLDRMTASIESERDGRAYNTYVNLYNGLVDMHNRSEANIQQAQNGYYRLLMYVTNAQQAEDVKKVIASFPLIMTQKQYQEAKAKREAERRAFAESYSGLVFHALSYYLGEYSAAKVKQSKPIAAALEALKKEPFNNGHVLSLINREYGVGYYLLPDGKRSDQLTDEEYRKELLKYPPYSDSPALAEIMATSDEEYLGRNGLQHTHSEAVMQSAINNFKAEWDGVDLDELSPVKWVDEEIPPEGLTKWDIIAGNYDMLEYYSGADTDDEAERVARFKEFISDFPGLANALKEDIAGIRGLEKIAKTTPARCCKDVITWGDLADLKAYAFQELVTVNENSEIVQDEAISEKNRMRAAGSGIAIIQEDRLTASRIDENGNYKQPYRALFSLFTGVETLEKDEQAQYYIERAREYLLLPALKEILAYNKLLEILADEYGVAELVEMQEIIEGTLGQVDALNGLTLSMYNTLPGTKEEIEVKRAIIKDLFPLVDLESLFPSEQAIEAVRRKLAADRGKIDLSQLYPLVQLMTAGEGGGTR